MITNNTDKKKLVEQLLSDKKITIEDAYMLLDEDAAIVTREYVPYTISQPVYPWHSLLPISTHSSGLCSCTMSGNDTLLATGTYTTTGFFGTVHNCIN